MTEEYDPTVCYLCGGPDDGAPCVRFTLEAEGRRCCLPCAGLILTEAVSDAHWDTCAGVLSAAFRHTDAYRTLMAGFTAGGKP